jgi:hypothetical protein
MPDESQQPPTPKHPAGYRPLVPAELRQGMGSSAYAYVAAAAGLGLLAGVAIAVTAGHANLSAAPLASDSVQPQASGLRTLPAIYTGPSASLLAKVDPQKKADSAQLLPASDTSGKKAGVHKKHGLHKFWHWKKDAGKNKTAKRMPYVSPNAPPVTEGPTALELASAAATAGPFVMVIQGEATIAGYDAGTGIIETYEGQTFVLDKTAGETSAIRWPDFPFNVHYRCDDNGGCTLVHGSATASAKLTR